MRTAARIAIAIAPLVVGASTGAAPIENPHQHKRSDQDPALNNLVHADGYQTAPLGTLGRVEKVGDGPRHMILIAGAGFGGDVFDGFMSARRHDFTMHAVTLPGFDGTPAPPMPETGTSYAEQTWTNAAVDALLRLIRDEGLEEPVVVAHWYATTQIAMRLAADHPNAVGSLVIISGIARYGLSIPEGTPPEARVRATDQIAETWFKTVTRDTWDDNNFLPGDYAIHPVRALQLWREAADAPLPVWVRYLCESWACDVTSLFERIEVPTLVLIPGFDDGFVYGASRSYMHDFCQNSWDGAPEANELITVQMIEDTRVFMMDDQPERLDEAIDAFLD